MKCGSCGAQIDATDLKCQFCGVVTQYGAQEHYQQQQHRAHLEFLEKQHAQQHDAQRQQTAQVSLKRTSKFALYWGVAGLLFCCAFFPSAVAVALGIRARKMSSKYQLVLPLNATLGLVLGALGLLAGAGFIAFVIEQNAQKEQRIAEIDRQLADSTNAQLSHNVACLLVERRLLKTGFRKDSSVNDPECVGKVLQVGDQATLEDVQFKASGEHFSVRACLTYAARWSVSGFRLKNRCNEADDTLTQSEK